ncbi:hypothetical protein AB0E01_00085 [Nocardia vinacea]|uniref:hypothetical protein n=1 Tax=Nocardia vinacea TaxID=96468 RepID=UPI0033FF0F0C
MGRTVHNPPPQYPGYQQAPPASYCPPVPPVPAGKPKGGKVSGLLLMILGVFPVLLGCGVIVKAIINGQAVTTNNAFAAVAWHDLTSEQIFPDYLTDISIGDNLQGWSRQSIAKETSCAEAFRQDFAEKLASSGCKTALRATYVDIGGTVAATLGVAVVNSYEAADAVSLQFPWNDAGTGPLVYPVAVPNTPAASWNKDLTMAGGAETIGLATTSPPYVAAISIGPVDNSRTWTSLPGQWSSDARSQKRIFQDLSTQVLLAYTRSSMLRGDQK